VRVFNEFDAVRSLSPEQRPREREHTGRYLVLLREDAVEEGAAALRAIDGLKVASTADFDSGVPDPDEVKAADAVVFQELGVALVDAPPERMTGVSAAMATDSAVLAVEPERVCKAIQFGAPGEAPSSPDYLRGYRDGVQDILGRRSLGPRSTEARAARVSFDESRLTWGLQVTRVDCSGADGSGIKVAVLDTGMFLAHGDFAGRTVTTESFITGETVDDVLGHGTHCDGTACGPHQPGADPRYGIAFGADIFVGKVLNNRGRGGDGGILAGVDWAVRNGCHIVSMSLGAPVWPGEGFSVVFEQAALRALAAGTLIVAAAGNESDRPGFVAPVGHPANCPSIMAVAAVDSQLQVAWFSNGAVNPQGGEVDIAGPGVDVRSSWLAPTLYRTISGTSMATPHVTGIAALWAQQTNVRGADLWKALTTSARDIGLPPEDVGAGLVQAPT
jgi:subtilisin family serine protease